jgi:hypothetical protein
MDKVNQLGSVLRVLCGSVGGASGGGDSGTSGGGGCGASGGGGSCGGLSLSCVMCCASWCWCVHLSVRLHLVCRGVMTVLLLLCLLLGRWMWSCCCCCWGGLHCCWGCCCHQSWGNWKGLLCEHC